MIWRRLPCIEPDLAMKISNVLKYMLLQKVAAGFAYL
jgi:hypothetical protein